MNYRYKKCAQCGQEKPLEDFSRLNKSLCVECMADKAMDRQKPATISGREPAGGIQFISHPRLTVAIAAMQGLLSSGMSTNSSAFVAKKSVEYADALLKELSKARDGVQ